MAVYSISRNIEASLIDFLAEKLEEYNWKNVSVIKGFKKVYDLQLPIIAIILDETYYNKTGIGENSTYRSVFVHFHIFATSDGQRLDLKDFLIGTLKVSAPYYEYTIEKGKVVSKNYICQLFVNDITDRKMNIIENISTLNIKDRYRHYLGINFYLPKIEGVR